MSIKELIQQNKATVIDVRNADELLMGKVPGCVNIPVHEIPYRIDEIKKLQAPLILYCRSGGRSSMAISLLKNAGCSHEMYNGGGYMDMLQLLN